MHGRLKVKTTAEQQEEKRKEREKKLAIYQKAIAKAFEKRSAQEYDKETTSITQQLLIANPDLTTMWNFRKEILLHLKKENDENLDTIFKDELSFIESCLKVNPKSYGAWYHRRWVLDTMANPDWGKELNLCDRYFELDERNFHCWDYRRFVVQRSKVSPEDELKFTMKLINNNFSNYSAWHYRSKLLPLVYSDSKSQLSITEEAHLSELDLVQNAAFTDPNDQSAWFYHRWLLGRGEESFKVLCLYINRKHSFIVSTITKPLTINLIEDCLKVKINDKEINQNWKSSNARENTSTVWILNLQPAFFQDGLSYEIEISSSYQQKFSKLLVKLDENQEEGWAFSIPDFSKRFRMELSAAKSSVLEQELNSCEQLQELEPDNKWTLLTSVLLMRAIDPDKFENEIIHHLENLRTLDINRENYYKDLYSKFFLEDILRHLDINQRQLDLTSKKLTALYNLDHLVLITKLDISNNFIRSLRGIHSMQCLRSLNANNNLIDSCLGLESLPLIEEISLENNKISTQDALDVLKKCNHLTIVRLDNNPLWESNPTLDSWMEKYLRIK